MEREVTGGVSATTDPIAFSDERKGFTGAAVLYLPRSFLNGGLLLGMAILALWHKREGREGQRQGTFCGLGLLGLLHLQLLCF